MDEYNGILRKWLLKAYFWLAEHLYHSLAWAYDFVAWLVSFGNWSRWRLDALHYLQPGSILEIGFGTGELLIKMAQDGGDIIGLELSPQMHTVTARKLSGKGLTVPRVRANTRAIPFDSGIFNNLISTFPSHYIAHEDTLDEIFRVLSPGGRVVIIGLGVRFKSPIKRFLTGWLIGDTSDNLIKGLVMEAEAAGFEASVVGHKAETYTLPILFLERPNG